MTAYVFRRATEVRAKEMLSVAERSTEAQHLPKSAAASQSPSSYALVRRAADNAVFLDSATTRYRGVPSAFLLIFIGGMALLLWPILTTANGFQELIQQGDYGWLVVDFVFLAFILAIEAAALSVVVRILRIDLFGPKEVPLVFNRKTRKVYKFIQNMPARDLSSLRNAFRYWLTAFQPWPMMLIEYEWDCLEAEYFERTTLLGNVVKTFHVLQFYVKETPDSDKVIGSFTIASPFMLGREIAMDIWEFIRCYMEEGGPVMCPGDKPAPAHPRNLWQAANTVWVGWPLVVGAAIWAANRVAQAPDLYSIDFLPFVTALVSWPFTLAIVFNWLGHKWGADVTLPPELMAEAGEPMDIKRISDEANGIAVPDVPTEKKLPSRIGKMRKSGKHR
ncbi:DUF6708 domain-containing protein [Viridibacterium curvum]|uniref:DUF6708 domain-containing protein n=1 Tax=Viridibacterium curvum TaxID=1101404 RepID=A0ABP9R730_9RHOO